LSNIDFRKHIARKSLVEIASFDSRKHRAGDVLDQDKGCITFDIVDIIRTVR